ncbi:hypothetical protein [Brevibacillus fulvus]|uniref:Uncharacterized protein n=1 Tax=Brevibacillus fulvus TaxID=1125967 RepID=A0A938XRI7_9BACL|nr:hypothetical protein [Brevibacillus fulvus]MBM7588517.1 hypothetical protein [Brevibacillus fulvus]
MNREASASAAELSKYEHVERRVDVKRHREVDRGTPEVAAGSRQLRESDEGKAKWVK